MTGLFLGMVLTLPFGYGVIVHVTEQIGRPQAAPLFAAAHRLVAGGVSAIVIVRIGLAGAADQGSHPLRPDRCRQACAARSTSSRKPWARITARSAYCSRHCSASSSPISPPRRSTTSPRWPSAWSARSSGRSCSDRRFRSRYRALAHHCGRRRARSVPSVAPLETPGWRRAGGALRRARFPRGRSGDAVGRRVHVDAHTRGARLRAWSTADRSTTPGFDPTIRSTSAPRIWPRCHAANSP